MRRILLLITALALFLALGVSVSAATSATSVKSQASVLLDESCEVILSVTVRVEQGVEDLDFPLPLDAIAVSLNGMRVGTSMTGEARMVDLTRITGGMPGEFTFIITYRLKDVVDFNDEGILQVTVPLLSGFAYPVEYLEATVSMPQAVAEKPAFSSGYHKSNIEQDLQFKVDGSVITATSLIALKDHETLEMNLTVTEELFPQKIIQLQDLDGFYLAMGIAAALAVLYWLIFLRNLPPRFITVADPPEGFSAGQMASVLNLRGANLTMMIFSWAQLGYLQIHRDKRDRTLLYKNMEMGNERSAFEQKCFRNLFSTRDSIDTTSDRYADLCHKISKLPPNIQGLVHPKSGSVFLFRALMCITGMICGICLGLTLSLEAAVQWFPAMLVAIFCGVGSWILQGWSTCLFSHRKGSIWAALAVMVLWIVMSALAKTFSLDGWVIFGQLLAGLMAAFGGRRTEAGRQAMSEALGLRRYLRRTPQGQLERISRQNPDYFHSMIPYALALGVDRGFSKHFGDNLMPDCPYMSGVTKEPLYADEWSALMRKTASAMDAKSRTKSLENFWTILRTITHK